MHLTRVFRSVAGEKGVVGAIRFGVGRYLRLREVRGELDAKAESLPIDQLARFVARKYEQEDEPLYAMQHEDEIAQFVSLVSSEAPKAVLEIGTASGGTLFLLCRAASDDALIVSVDLPGGRHGGGYSALRKPIYRSFAKARQKVVLIRRSSRDARARARIGRLAAQTGGFGLVFVDGDHSYEGVRSDYEAYWPLLTKGGLMAFHDIHPGSRDAGTEVPHFWAEVRVLHRSAELFGRPATDKFGIGLVWKDE